MKVIVTAGPTFEPIDPVRFIGNRSSGKQGYAIAKALADQGHDVTLVSGPTNLPPPDNVTTQHIETADEMLAACESILPADITICAAAVSDWTPAQPHTHKLKKQRNINELTLKLKKTPDILHTLANHINRPKLVIGFAAETQNLEENAKAKLEKKGCDAILANLVAQKDKKTFGEDRNHVYFITPSKIEDWGETTKENIASKLTQKIEELLRNE